MLTFQLYLPLNLSFTDSSPHKYQPLGLPSLFSCSQRLDKSPLRGAGPLPSSPLPNQPFPVHLLSQRTQPRRTYRSKHLQKKTKKQRKPQTSLITTHLVNKVLVETSFLGHGMLIWLQTVLINHVCQNQCNVILFTVLYFLAIATGQVSVREKSGNYILRYGKLTCLKKSQRNWDTVEPCYFKHPGETK